MTSIGKYYYRYTWSISFFFVCYYYWVRIRSIYHGLFLIFNLQSNCFLFHFIVIVLCCVSIYLFFVSRLLSEYTNKVRRNETHLSLSLFLFSLALLQMQLKISRERERERKRQLETPPHLFFSSPFNQFIFLSPILLIDLRRFKIPNRTKYLLELLSLSIFLLATYLYLSLWKVNYNFLLKKINWIKRERSMMKVK